jgi:hypothetical protein
LSGIAARAAFAGEDSGFVAGVTWVPAEALDALVYGTGAHGPAESLETLARALELDFAFVPASEPWAAEAVTLLHNAGVAAVWTLSGVLGRVGESVGWTEMLRMTAAEPGTLAGALAETLHDALDDARAGAAAGADAILVADDLAGATGPLVSPDFALDALVPCYSSIASEAHRSDLPALFHSDGDVRTLFPALARGGFSAVHLAGLSAEGVVASYTAARSARLSVLGGIEASALMRGARHLGERAAALALAGGMLVCDDGGITSAEEVAAFATALDAARAAFAAGSDGDS